MLLIDAEQLEKDGWKLERIRPVDAQTMLWENKKPTELDEAVVRCRNCRHYNYRTCSRFGIHITKKDDAFCSEGVAKKDAG